MCTQAIPSSELATVPSQNENSSSSRRDSQFPQLSTQIGLENIDLQEEDEIIEGSSKMKTERGSFSVADCKQLIMSRMDISEDSQIGAAQKGDKFWHRVMENFNKYRGPGTSSKNASQLQHEWQKINKEATTFAGCHSEAERCKRSGMTETDVLEMAYQLYEQSTKRKFKMQAYWEMLKDHPRWNAEQDESGTKRTKTSATGAYSSSSNPATPTSEPTSDNNVGSGSANRPMGREAAKKKSEI
ncbi:glutathione S-transferase THETA 3 [Striga asiatica]|uniref:Glutathione S-transferase THETA 3 n=1 Tax=Striga asiatica TaxID=4170 RepID=A0A5A7RAM7_STRAF|nr:glutathione S-transferase THETA 3 [Striga asiatica]